MDIGLHGNGKGAFAPFLFMVELDVFRLTLLKFFAKGVDKICGLWYNVGTVKETILNIEKVVTYYDYQKIIQNALRTSAR